MAIGGNYPFNNRNNFIGKLKDDLQAARAAFTDYAKNADSDDWSWDELDRLEREVVHAEYELWCEEYEDNRRRTWK